MSAAAQSPGWRARLDLHYEQCGGATFLARRRHVGPLLVQRPFYPEGGVCHTYVVHPPGGVVGGDELELNVDAAPATEVLITTPAAAKFYRSAGPTALQTQTLTARSAAIEWLPQETIFHRAARVRSATRVALVGDDARFIGWEIACLGLPARNEPFSSGELRLHFELWVDDRPRLIDRQQFAGGEGARVWRLNGREAIGTLLAYPATRALRDRIADIAHSECELAVTLVDGVLACRALAAQAEPIKRAFVDVWRLLRPAVMHRETSLPRIWAT